ncbi:hypothetical protein BCC13_004678, partial [Escherichia coli]|nr:hypothetical protein [Escherichia coli]EFI6779185.1 hypothetical protein [Escherichia coli]
DALYLQQQNYSLEALSRRDAREDPFASTGKTALAQPPDGASDGNPAYISAVSIRTPATAITP